MAPQDNNRMSTRQTLLPLIILTLLFGVWGFTGGLLSTMSQQFQVALGITKREAAAMQASFFAAFAVGGPTYGMYLVKRAGYRWTFTSGLVLYGIGSLLFFPAGAKRSWAAFCVAAFVKGSGVACFDVAAFPYMSMCGPAKWAEVRIAICVMFQTLANISGSMLVGYVIYRGKNNVNKSVDKHTQLKPDPSKDISPIQYVGLAVGCSCFLLAVLMATLRKRIPEISDANNVRTQESTGLPDDTPQDRPFRKQYTLFWGMAAVFCYTGCQDSLATYFVNFSLHVCPTMVPRDATKRFAIAQGCFIGGQIFSIIAMRFVKPRHLLLVQMTVLLACLSAAVCTPCNVSMVFITLEYFFKSSVGLIVYVNSLRGLGRHTKTGAGLLVACVGGGAVFPPITGAVADILGTQLAFAVPLGGLLVTYSFAIYLNIARGREIDTLRGQESSQPQMDMQSTPCESSRSMSRPFSGLNNEEAVKVADKEE